MADQGLHRVSVPKRYSKRHIRRLVQKENELCSRRIKSLVEELVQRKISDTSKRVEDDTSSSVVAIVAAKSVVAIVDAKYINEINAVEPEELIGEKVSPGIMNNSAIFFDEKKKENRLSEYYDVDETAMTEDEELTYRYSDCEDSASDSDESSDGKSRDSVDRSVKETCGKISIQLQNVFAFWSTDCLITQADQKKFLHSLRDGVPLLNLPLDPRTIHKFKKYGDIHIIKGGEYCHFGMESVLEKIVYERTCRKIKNVEIKLLINMDGAPTGKDAQKSLWPILASDQTSRKVYIIGVFNGTSKPEEADEFLSLFVKEAVFFVNNGILIDEILYNVSIDGFILDAPAKSFILGVKCHSGYFSCTKCEIKGQFYKCVSFPGSAHNLRTDEDFAAFAYKEQGYQIRKTLLMQIPRLGLVAQVPLDPMHLIFVGVVKKLIIIWKYWLTKYRLSIAVIHAISLLLLEIRPYVPYEFARKPRHLKDIKQFKATELRQLVLYTGVLIFIGKLHKSVYTNFVTLHVIVSIYSNPILCKIPEWINYAEELSKIFVRDFEKLYGSGSISHNVHNVLHLADDVKRYGELENFSAFRFENFIARLKRLLRSGNKISEQLINRCSEIKMLEDTTKEACNKNTMYERTTPIVDCSPDLRQPHFSGPVPNKFTNVAQYKIGVFESFKINCDDAKNNYVYINNTDYVEVSNIIKSDAGVYVVGRTLSVTGPLYHRPCSSSKLGINILDPRPTNTGLQYWNVNEITAKLFIMPKKQDIVAFPILHTLR